MFTTHTYHVVSVDDAEYSLPSSPFGSTRLPTSSNGVSSCPSPASSLSSLPDSRSLSPLTLPSEREPPSPVPAVRGAGSASDSTSTTKSRTRPVTRSRIPKVRIIKLGGMASSAAPNSKSDAGSSTSQEAGTIPKPEGENGRPNRGGYTLSKILGWTTKEYREAQTFVREILPSNVPFTSQHPEKLTIVQEKMLKQFPALCRYEDGWAADDFIRTAVKYRQSRVKLHDLKVQAAQGKALADMQSSKA